MAKIIAHTIFAPGHLYPFICVLKELQRRGFAVKLCVSTPANAVPKQLGGIPVKRIRTERFESFSANEGRGKAQRVWLANLSRNGDPAAVTMGRLLRKESPDCVLV